MSKVTLLVTACILLTLVPALPASAQTTGTIRGRVTDPDGLPLPGSKVVIESESLLGGTRQMVTGTNGGFNFVGLPTGEYTLTVTLDSFDPYTVEGVRVALNRAATVNVTLRLAGVEDTLMVTAEPPLVDVASSSVATNFDASFIEDLPTARNFFDLVQVSPGISNPSGYGDRVVAFGSNVQSSAWNIDGIDQTAPETGAAWIYLPPDAIAEVQVMGIGAPAEFGNMAGAAINIVTKSGSNEFHGTADFHFQDDSLSGDGPNLDYTDLPAFTREKYNEFSATLGGPIARDRVWFFLSGRSRRDEYAEAVDMTLTKPNKEDDIGLKLSMRVSDQHFLDLTGRSSDWDFPYYVSPYIDADASSGERGRTPSWSAAYRGFLSDSTMVQAKYAGWWTDDLWDSATGSPLPGILDVSPPGGGPPTESQGLLWPTYYETWSHQASADVTYFAQDFIEGDHEFKFGVQYSHGEFVNAWSPGPTGTYYYHYAYDYYGSLYHYYYQVLQQPFHSNGVDDAVALFVDDSWTLNDRLTLNLGLRFDRIRGKFPDVPELSFSGMDGRFPPVWDSTGVTIPGREILSADVYSPRLGFAWTPTKSGKTVVRGSYGIYRDRDVGGNWDFPAPGYPPYQWYWLPNWGPGCSAGDAACLADRLLVYEFNTDNIAFSSGLKLPRTSQFSIGFEQEFRDTFSFGAQLIYKDTQDLVGWHIEGGVFEPVEFTDPFTGEVFTLLNMIEEPILSKANGPGMTAAGEINQYWQKYEGVILTFKKRFLDNWGLQASYTWSKSWGLIPRMLTQGQFEPFYSSMEGSNPNNYINADQRLQADRPHMFRAQANYLAPWGIELGAVVDLRSGRAHNRQIRVPASVIGAGTTVIMEPAGSESPAFGTLRYPFEYLVDLAIGKRIDVKDVTLKLDAWILNLLDEDAGRYETLALQEGDDFVPTSFVFPRRIMLRAGVGF